MYLLTKCLRPICQDVIGSLEYLFNDVSVSDDPEHCLIVRFLLPEERLNSSNDQEFEIIDGNDRIVLLLKHGIKVWNHYIYITNKVEDQTITWEVSAFLQHKFYIINFIFTPFSFLCTKFWNSWPNREMRNMKKHLRVLYGKDSSIL